VDFDEVVAQLQGNRDEKIATIYGRRNPGAVAWGVRFGDMDTLIKRIKQDSELARALWATGVLEPRIVACRIMRPPDLTETETDQWVTEIDWPYLADVFANLVYKTPFADRKRVAWTQSRQEFVRRAGFMLVHNAAADLKSDITDDEFRAYLDQIGREIHDSPNWSREMMNMVPIAIGLRNDALRPVAIATATGYGKVDVFHGDKTNCKIWDAVAALNDPRTKVKAP
jgi:hypothetical protein